MRCGRWISGLSYRCLIAFVTVVAMVAVSLPLLGFGDALAATGDVSIATIDLGLRPGMAAGNGEGAGSWGYGFPVYEGAHGDLNGDGDTSDDVMHVWIRETGAVANLGLSGLAGGAADWGLAFMVDESDEGPGGTDLNGDGDTDDEVIHVWVAATGTVTNLGAAGSWPRMVDDFGLGFEVSEADQGSGGTDLNGDGDTSDSVIHVWDSATGSVTNLGLAGEVKSAAAWGLGMSVSEADEAGSDLNGDGDADDRVFHRWDAATGAVANLGLAGFRLSADDWGFGFQVIESWQGAVGTDLNGDGDKDDDVVHVWDASTGAVTNLVLAGGSSAGSWGLALSISEFDQGGTDFNGDGDTGDEVIHVWDVATGTASNLGLAEAGFPWRGAAVDDFGYGFEVSEADQDSDLNGDGDKSDAVIHVWAAATNTVTNLALPSRGGGYRFSVASWGFTFQTDDGVLHVWEDTTGEVISLGRFDEALAAAAWGFSLVPNLGPQTVHIALVNRAPVGEPDTYSTPAGDTLVINGVLDNDSDPDDDALTAVEVMPTGDGDLNLNTDGSFTYVPDADFSGLDSFTYRAFDGELESSPITVTIEVEAPGIFTVGLVDAIAGRWHLRNEAGQVTTIVYGNPGDYPFMGDWDCDGDDTPGLYRQSDGFVYLRNSNTQGNADIRFFFGDPGDVPLAGDFDGDDCDTLSVYRPSEARVYIINELGANDGGLGVADLDYLFGNLGDKPFVGDFDGDGVDTIGLHRESTGLVYFRNSHTQGIADAQFFFGDPDDRMMAGDWNNDGTDSPALFRPSDATFYFRYTNTQGIADEHFAFGDPDFLPVAGVLGLG